MEAKRVLVTGGTGFIGSNLVSRLAQLGLSVGVVVRENSKLPPSWVQLSGLTIYVHDGSQSRLNEILKCANPELVFHLAASASYDHEGMIGAQMIESNIVFPTQLLEAMRYCGVRRIINTETFWQHRSGKVEYSPVCLYAATKQAFRDVLINYTENHSFGAISLVLYDVFGANDPRDKLINLLARKYESRDEVAMTLGEQVVSMVHVDDVVSAYLVAADRLMNGRPQNFETFCLPANEPTKLRALLENVFDMCGLDLKIKWGTKSYRNSEVMAPWIGTVLPGWHPEVSPVEGISDILARHKNSNVR
jgi:nucleoside-diphosphate-sugar epimerase